MPFLEWCGPVWVYEIGGFGWFRVAEPYPDALGRVGRSLKEGLCVVGLEGRRYRRSDNPTNGKLELRWECATRQT